MSSALLLVIVMLLLGYGCRRFGVFEPAAADTLHRFVIYICLPALIWRWLPALRFEAGLWVLVCVPWLLLLAMIALLYAAARVFGWSRSVLGALLLCVPLGNTSFLGYPLVSALLGESAVKYAVLYDQFGSFLILSSYGVGVVAWFGGAAAPTLRQALLRIVRFPPFIALLLAFTPIVRWPMLQPLWVRLGDALVPLAMFAVGLRLELKLPRPRSALVVGLALKLLVMPGLAWLFARGVNAGGVTLQVTVLQAGMPSMITAGALAMAAGLAPELAAALVGYGVWLGLVSVPLIAAAL